MKFESVRLPISAMGQSLSAIDVSNAKVYGNYLAQTYYYVSHSTRLLAFAAGLMTREDEPHFRSFLNHIREETAHEILAERDLQDLDMRPDDFEQLPQTRALWEPQYYKIQHEHPLVLMGYIIALESFAATYLPEFYQIAKSLYNNKACRFIKLHAEEDPAHIEKAIQLTSTLSPSLQEKIVLNVVQTAVSYTTLVNACAVMK